MCIFRIAIKNFQLIIDVLTEKSIFYYMFSVLIIFLLGHKKRTQIQKAHTETYTLNSRSIEFYMYLKQYKNINKRVKLEYISEHENNKKIYFISRKELKEKKKKKEL